MNLPRGTGSQFGSLPAPGESVKFVTRKIERPKEEWIAVPVPPLVPEKLWDMANQMLNKNAQTGRRNGKHPYLLTGLLKCASCGYSYVGGSKRRRSGPDISYYRCSSRVNMRSICAACRLRP